MLIAIFVNVALSRVYDYGYDTGRPKGYGSMTLYTYGWLSELVLEYSCVVFGQFY